MTFEVRRQSSNLELKMTSPIPVKGERHCAFCLKLTANIKLCGACKKRGYCSQECQKQDWKDFGQNHKVWCQLDYGEEDLDWKVEAIPGKGLGIIALRDFPPLTRIMVDRGYTRSEVVKRPQVMDLEPKDGSLDDKFHLNSVSCGEFDSVVSLRMSRFNHACISNACHYYEENTKTKVVHSSKNIKAGDEITIRYSGFFELDQDLNSCRHQMMLISKWKIICPVDCACKDEKNWELDRMIKELDQNIFVYAKFNQLKALKTAKDLLKLYDQAKFMEPIQKQRTLYDAFQMAIMQKATLPEGIKFIQEASDIVSSAVSPFSSNAKKYRMYLEDPSKHPYYLMNVRKF